MKPLHLSYLLVYYRKVYLSVDNLIFSNFVYIFVFDSLLEPQTNIVESINTYQIIHLIQLLPSTQQIIRYLNIIERKVMQIYYIIKQINFQETQIKSIVFEQKKDQTCLILLLTLNILCK